MQAFSLFFACVHLGPHRYSINGVYVYMWIPHNTSREICPPSRPRPLQQGLFHTYNLGRHRFFIVHLYHYSIGKPYSRGLLREKATGTECATQRYRSPLAATRCVANPVSHIPTAPPLPPAPTDEKDNRPVRYVYISTFSGVPVRMPLYTVPHYPRTTHAPSRGTPPFYQHQNSHAGDQHICIHAPTALTPAGSPSPPRPRRATREPKDGGGTYDQLEQKMD